MMRKLLVLTSFAAGYVAGSAAGRERYEQIRNLVLGVAHDPKVQNLANEAAEFAQEHGSAVADKVTEKVSGGHDDQSTSNQQSADSVRASLNL